MKRSWPSIMRSLFGDHKRYQETYFSAYKVCLAGRQRLIVLLLTLCCAAYLQQPDEATIEAAVFLTLRYLVLTVLSLAEYHPCLYMLTFADEATLRTLQDGVPLFLDLLQYIAKSVAVSL